MSSASRTLRLRLESCSPEPASWAAVFGVSLSDTRGAFLSSLGLAESVFRTRSRSLDWEMGVVRHPVAPISSHCSSSSSSSAIRRMGVFAKSAFFLISRARESAWLLTSWSLTRSISKCRPSLEDHFITCNATAQLSTKADSIRQLSSIIDSRLRVSASSSMTMTRRPSSASGA